MRMIRESNTEKLISSTVIFIIEYKPTLDTPDDCGRDCILDRNGQRMIE